MTKDMLTRIGYEVVQAACGEDAVALVKDSVEKHNPIQAAILDLTIPGRMGGKEAVIAFRSAEVLAKVFNHA